MQLTTVFTTLTMAMAVAATRTTTSVKTTSVKATSTTKSGAPAQTATNCSSTQTPACLNKFYPGFLGITLQLLNILNQQCPSGSTIACCDTSGVQNGLINIGTICIPVTVVV